MLMLCIGGLPPELLRVVLFDFLHDEPWHTMLFFSGPAVHPVYESAARQLARRHVYNIIRIRGTLKYMTIMLLPDTLQTHVVVIAEPNHEVQEWHCLNDVMEVDISIFY